MTFFNYRQAIIFHDSCCTNTSEVFCLAYLIIIRSFRFPITQFVSSGVLPHVNSLRYIGKQDVPQETSTISETFRIPRMPTEKEASEVLE